MGKLKIFVLTTSYYPFIGGAEIAIQEVARRLKDRFDPAPFVGSKNLDGTPPTKGAGFDFYIVTSRFRRDLSKREIRPEGIVIRLGLGTHLDKWFFPFLAFWNVFGQHSVLTMLWGVDIGMGSLTAAILKIFKPKIPFVFTIQYGYGEARLKRGRWGFIGLAFRFILSRADYVTAISTHLLNLAKEYGYKGPGEVIPNGVDIRRFAIHDTRSTIHGKKIVVTTSRLVQKNGIDTLISAIAEVKKTMPDVQCWIIGDGPERKKLELQITSYKLQANVKLFGQIPYDKIPEYLHKADIFVRPSRSEGMGNSFVEALAAGLPIIGTPVGGITDVIENGITGIFSRADDPGDLAEKIKLLLEDERLSLAIIENGRKMVEKRFSWDKISASYGRIFLGQRSVLTLLIAAPLYPPQLGGPALYAKNLGEEFKKMGYGVHIFSFGPLLRYPNGIRHFLYFLGLLRQTPRSSILFALDYTSVGFPAALASLIFRKPLVIRLEGDFLWENFVERAHRDVTLSDFYREPQSLSRKERLIRMVSFFVFRRASSLAFSSEWRRKMMVEAYGIPREKTVIIRNAFPSVKPQATSHKPQAKVILWAGRMLYLKNLKRLIRAFAKANDGSWGLHLVGGGSEKESLKAQVKSLKLEKNIKFFDPAPHDELLEKMRNSAFLVLPSLSEVGPNVIVDALNAGTPFIMTSETGYTEYVASAAVLVDPLSEDDLATKLKFLMDEKNRESQRKKVGDFSISRSWREAAGDWIKTFQEL